MNCKICGRECKNYNSLAQHIKKHKISSKEYYDKYLSPYSEHTCKYCGKKVTKFLNINKGYATTCGIDCARHNVFKHIDIKARNEKAAKTKLEKYGSPTYNNPEKRAMTSSNYTAEQKQAIITKRKNTCQARYGVDAPMQSADIRKHWSDNYFAKTGYRHQGENPEVQEKIKQTMIKKYGADNCRKSDVIKEKIRATKQLLYGNQNNIEKTKLTNLERYGAECCWANPDIRAKCFTRYVYENINFDSSLELAFYIYHKNKGDNIERNNSVFFEYTLNNEVHRCFPDFKIGETLYEIKGDQFMDEKTGKWIDPFASNKHGFYEAKHLCLLQHNVKIIYQKDMRPYLDYIDDYYGKNYLKQFRKSQKEGEKK